MSSIQPHEAVIFDMDGLLIDSEPLWHQAELEVFVSLGKDPSLHQQIPDSLGMRIDLVVELWYQLSPWSGESLAAVTQRIVERAMVLVDERRPLLPGVEQALALVKSRGLKIGLASASPLFMLENVLEMFGLRHYFDHLESAQHLRYSKPHPEVYLLAATHLDVQPDRCITLEDSFNGMIATKAARMRSIVVPDAAYRADPRWAVADVRLASLLELRPEHLG